MANRGRHAPWTQAPGAQNASVVHDAPKLPSPLTHTPFVQASPPRQGADPVVVQAAPTSPGATQTPGRPRHCSPFGHAAADVQACPVATRGAHWLGPVVEEAQ